MLKSPRLVGRDIRTLLCAPQPGRAAAACGRTNIASDAYGSQGSSAAARLPERGPSPARNHSSPLSRAAGSLAALTLLLTCGQSAAAEPRLEFAQAATGAATSQPRLTPQQREADYVAQLDKMVAPLLDYQLSDEDNTKINAAFKALSGSDLTKAKDLQAGLSDPLARKLIEWERLRRGEGQAADYLKFLSENPDWPSREQLQRRMEETLFEEGGDTDVIATYFKGREARSPAGMAVLASVHMAHGEKDQGEGAGREDLAREGSACQPREGFPHALRIDAQ